MRILSLAGGNAGKIIDMPFAVAQRVIRSGLGKAIDDSAAAKPKTETQESQQDQTPKKIRRRSRARSKKGR